MKLFRNNLAAVMSAGLVFAGVALLFSATGPQVLSVKQTLQVTGGTINGVKLLYTDCPEASIVCSENECDENDECPENTIETYQSYETYPYGTGAGSDFATTVPATYQCNHYKACSNPCSTSTEAPFLKYCGGPVGPLKESEGVAGAQGGEPFRTEA